MRCEANVAQRTVAEVVHRVELAVIGGGLAGVCCAITAARAGVRVALIQDRPVLGGNASSEVRLWALGATSHMGNNNRWAREGGVINEILLENLYRNPEGNPLIFDTILLEKVVCEPNIELLLNTAVYDLEKEGAAIRLVRGYCSQSETRHVVQAPLFCDASGDGIAAFLAGAAFRVGAEGRSEFDEGFAPATPNEECLGHTLYFYSKDAGHPVAFVPPAFALKDITRIPRWRDIKAGDCGCKFWWLEWGGRTDTVHNTEAIKWELWQVVHGVWNHIKNSGLFPGAANLTLEWVGLIPGKRESRRFEGDYWLTQRDIIGQRPHPDAVAFGGWAIDLHPADGLYSPEAPCIQWHSKGVYPIPFRCLYSRDIPNLFLAGRNVSASHVAFGSTRVMATGALMGQAVGMASAQRRTPRAVDVVRLQQDLLRAGHHIPGVPRRDAADLAQSARITASSELRIESLPPDGGRMRLSQPWALMAPVQPGPMPRSRFTLSVDRATTLRAELRVSSRPDNHTPDTTLAVLEIPLAPGADQKVELGFEAMIDVARYAFICLMANEDIDVALSGRRLTGLLALTHVRHGAVAKAATQNPSPGSGIDCFEFWIPQRRPEGKNLAVTFSPPLAGYEAANVANGTGRPTCRPNAWSAAFGDPAPAVTLAWDEAQTLGRVVLDFDCDYDHPMESVFMRHPERVIPFCVREGEVRDAEGRILATFRDNHQARVELRFEKPVQTRQVTIVCHHPDPDIPAALLEVSCYAS